MTDLDHMFAIVCAVIAACVALSIWILLLGKTADQRAVTISQLRAELDAANDNTRHFEHRSAELEKHNVALCGKVVAEKSRRQHADEALETLSEWRLVSKQERRSN